MESLATLLAVSLGRDPNSPDFGADELDARITLNGLVRVLRDEDLAVELGRRLYESRVVISKSPSWDELDAENRNHCILQALDVLDALRDLINEELYPGGG